jgi:hypothetical protein
VSNLDLWQIDAVGFRTNVRAVDRKAALNIGRKQYRDRFNTDAGVKFYARNLER